MPAVGVVLRGVVVGGEARALGRPRSAAPVAALAWPVDKAAVAHKDGLNTDGVVVGHAAPAVPEAKTQLQGSQAPGNDPEHEYQEHGRGFQTGYEEGRQQGRADGFEAGRAEGHEAGMRAGLEQGGQHAQQEAEQSRAAARQALQQQTKQLDALLASLTAQLEQRLADAEEDMVALCFETVVRIVGETAASAQGVRAILRQALAEVNSSESLTVHVHPRDLALLQSGEDAAELAGRRPVQWMGDERVELGGCLVVTAHGSLDARIETQLARLATLFAGLRKDGEAA